MLRRHNWEPYESGTYNNTWIYRGTDYPLIRNSKHKGPWILKQQKDQDDKTDDATRAVELWYTINGTSAGPVAKYGQYAWVSPFIEGPANDDQAISKKILEIYRDHRRIVIDGCDHRNFK